MFDPLRHTNCVSIEAHARKISEKRDALAQRDQAVKDCQAALTAIARVRALHSEIPYKPGRCYCANAYPCPTIRALEGGA